MATCGVTGLGFVRKRRLSVTAWVHKSATRGETAADREERGVGWTFAPLQLDDVLIAELHAKGFEVAVETNGTIAASTSLDWVCVSPKSVAELKHVSGDELKLVYPQSDAPPETFASLAFRNFFLQPMDGPDREANTAACIAYCLAHPQWRLSLQTHKVTGIP